MIEMVRYSNAVILCLSKDSLPIHTVDKLRFCCLLKKMDPQYDLPSSKYFSKVAIPGFYQKNLGEIRA